MFIFLEEYKKTLGILNFGLMPTLREQFHECRIRLLPLFPSPRLLCVKLTNQLAQMEQKSETSFSYQSKRFHVRRWIV